MHDVVILGDDKGGEDGEYGRYSKEETRLTDECHHSLSKDGHKWPLLRILGMLIEHIFKIHNRLV